MKRITLRIALLLCIWMSLAPFAAMGKEALPDSKEKLAQFLTLAEELREQLNVPGAGIGIVVDNEVIYVGGVGFRDVEEAMPVTADTLFAIGSNTKAFTGLLVSKLVAEGKLDWDEPVNNFIPDLKLSDPYVTKHMTLADACSHMTGIARRDDLWKGEPLSRDEVFEQITELPFDFSFRGQFSYNNHMYVLVGKAIEHASGSSWDNNIRTRIFEPLGMNQSFTTYDEFMAHPERSTGYAADGSTPVSHLNVDNIGPAGSISSTARDYAKWLNMWVNAGVLDGKPFVSPAEYDRLAKPRSASMVSSREFKSYWAGWSEKILDGQAQLIHSGGIDGQSARILVRPSDGFGIFVLTNQVSDFKALLVDYGEQIFVDDNFKRNRLEEERLASVSAFGRFRTSLLAGGIEAGRQTYRNLRTKNFENAMNDLGYKLIAVKELEAAKFVFELNCEDHSQSANAWDSLGECCFLMKDYKAALENYSRSVELDAENENAKQTILKLKELMKD